MNIVWAGCVFSWEMSWMSYLGNQESPTLKVHCYICSVIVKDCQFWKSAMFARLYMYNAKVLQSYLLFLDQICREKIYDVETMCTWICHRVPVFWFASAAAWSGSTRPHWRTPSPFRCMTGLCPCTRWESHGIQSGSFIKIFILKKCRKSLVSLLRCLSLVALKRSLYCRFVVRTSLHSGSLSISD